MNVKKLHEFKGHKGSIYKTSEGVFDNTVLSFSGDGNIVEWDLNSDKPGILRAKSEFKFFTGLAHPSSDSCFAGDMNGTLYQLFFNKKENNVKAWKTHQKGLFSIVKTGDFLFSGGGDGTLTKWTADPFFPLLTNRVASDRLRCLLWDEKRELLLTGSSDGAIYLIEPGELRVVEKYDNAHESSVFSMVFKGEKQLITGGKDAHINFWKYPEMQLEHRIPAHMFTINDLSLSPCFRFLASAGRDKEIRIWDTETFKLTKVIDRMKFGGHTHSVNSVFWHPQTSLLCSGGDDCRLLIWKIED